MSISVEGADTPSKVTLLEEEASETVSAIWDSLPIEGKLLHARHSGDEVLTEMHGDDTIELEPENWVSNVVPGDVGYWYSHWGEGKHKREKRRFSEVVIIYGRNVKLRSGVDTNGHINLFGSVAENFEPLANACRSVHTEGPKRILVEKIAE